jgi:hypothetical protein
MLINTFCYTEQKQKIIFKKEDLDAKKLGIFPIYSHALQRNGLALSSTINQRHADCS